MELFTVTAPGLASITAGELAGIGATGAVVTDEGVAFQGDMDLVMRANLHSRTASHVLVRMGSFRARTFAELERHAANLPWRDFTALGQSCRFRVTARKCRLFHTAAISERLARVAGVTQPGANDDTAIASAAQLFVVRGVRDEWMVSADSSGANLHKRGYRRDGGKAPLRETLAAAMVLATEWDPTTPFIDPFCGSGTLVIEAAMIARQIAPGSARDFSFMRWSGFQQRQWDAVVAEARAGARASANAPILGFDRDAGAIESARANAARAGVGPTVEFARQTVSELEAPEAPARAGSIVCNPPYGVRVGDRIALRDLYARFGAVVRERFSGWRVAYLSADPTLDRATELELTPLLRTTNGGLPVRLMLANVV